VQGSLSYGGIAELDDFRELVRVEESEVHALLENAREVEAGVEAA